MPPRLRALLDRRGPLAVVLLATLVAVLVSLRREPPVGLCVLGDVRAYLAAHVPPPRANARSLAADIEVGVGKAAIDGWPDLGEALAVGGRVYVRSADHGAPHYYRVRAAREFLTSSFAYVPRGRAPRLRYTTHSAQGFGALWRELGARFPDGVLVAGYVEFQRLASIAISRPAIRALPLPEHSVRYYTEPLETREHIWAYVVGLAARAQPSPARRDDPQFARALARRADGGLEVYAEALSLAAPPLDPGAPPDPDQALGLGRVTDASQIARAELALYPVGRVGDCAAASRRETSD
jgi:hypothetical protein